MTDSAQGVDTSAFQGVVDWPSLAAGKAFAFVKATDGGNGETDAQFRASWSAVKSAGLHRGAYHELAGGGTAAAGAQAAQFLAVVRAALEPGDMLAVVASDYSGVTGPEVLAWCDAVRAAAGPQCPVIVYTDLSDLSRLADCTAYELWIAHPSGTAPASVAPWETWRLWQWGQAGGVDQDAYNGTAAELDAWIATYAAAPPQPAPTWEDTLLASIPAVQKASTDKQAVKNWQALLVARGHDLGVTGERKDGIDGVWGELTQAATIAFQKASGLTQDGIAGPLTYGAALGG